jgi:hypothetical protein
MTKKPEFQNDLNDFSNKLLGLTGEYAHIVPVYEIVNRMIADATSMSLCLAPNELVGFKTIMASIENGIAEYEATHS